MLLAFVLKIRVNPCSSASNYMLVHGAVNYVEFTAATNPTWFVAERVGFEPT